MSVLSESMDFSLKIEDSDADFTICSQECPHEKGEIKLNTPHSPKRSQTSQLFISAV